MPFGQLVIGTPGSGKSTYCAAMRAHLTALGRRVAVVNLDPANDAPPYECDVDIAKLISLADATEAHGLGPNGALVFCFEYLAANADWLADQLAPLTDAHTYLLIDCPGQIELFTHHEAVRTVTDALSDRLDLRCARARCVGAREASYPSCSAALAAARRRSALAAARRASLRASATLTARSYRTLTRPDLRLLPVHARRLCAVHLLDAHHCAEVSKYVSGLVVSLSAMLALELPHINVLSKIDLAEAAGPLALPLSFFAEASDLQRLLPFAEGAAAFSARHAALTAALCELVEDFGLLSFLPLCASDHEALRAVCAAADKACGYAFGAREAASHAALFGTAASTLGHDYDRVAAFADRYGGGDDEDEGAEGARSSAAAAARAAQLDGSDADALAAHYHEQIDGDDDDDDDGRHGGLSDDDDDNEAAQAGQTAGGGDGVAAGALATDWRRSFE
jgi:GTPase SAR1 family protein